MALLAATHYDPSTIATVSTATAIAMTPLDATNLSLTFTAPPNGNVLVRLKGGALFGATTAAQILLGVMDHTGGTVRGRQSPMSGRTQGSATVGQLPLEASFLVTGLTPGSSNTWDAAYGVETVVASTTLRWGGPDNTTGGDAVGGFSFEIWETTNLLAGINYDPAAAVAKVATPSAAMTALDTTVGHLRLTFTTNVSGPGSTTALVRQRFPIEGGTAIPVVLSGVLDGATVRGRTMAMGLISDTASTMAATTRYVCESSAIVTGLTANTSYTWDAAWGVEATAASNNIRYGGPNNTTADDAWGGYAYEIWAC